MECRVLNKTANEVPRVSARSLYLLRFSCFFLSHLSVSLSRLISFGRLAFRGNSAMECGNGERAIPQVIFLGRTRFASERPHAEISLATEHTYVKMLD